MMNDNIILPRSAAQKIARVLGLLRHGEVWAETKLHEALNTQAVGYSSLEMEAMLGIWEAMLEMRDTLPAMDEMWTAFGTVTMRLEEVPRLAKLALEVWDKLDEYEQEDLQPYDWEFLPKVVRWAYAEGAPPLLDYLRGRVVTVTPTWTSKPTKFGVNRVVYTNNDHESDGA